MANKLEYLVQLNIGDDDLRKKIHNFQGDLDKLSAHEKKIIKELVQERAKGLAENIKANKNNPFFDQDSIKKEIEFVRGLMSDMKNLDPMADWAKQGKDFAQSISGSLETINKFIPKVEALTAAVTDLQHSFANLGVGIAHEFDGEAIIKQIEGVDAKITKSMQNAQKLKNKLKQALAVEPVDASSEALNKQIRALKKSFDMESGINPDSREAAKFAAQIKGIYDYAQKHEISIEGLDSKYMTRVNESVNNALNNIRTIEKEYERAVDKAKTANLVSELSKQIKHITIDVDLNKANKAKFIEQINQYVDSIKPNRLNKIQVDLGLAKGHKTAFIEEVRKNITAMQALIGSGEISEQDAGLTKPNVVATAITDREKSLLKSTKDWHAQMVEALSFKKDELTFEFGLDDRTTLGAQSLVDALQEYFDQNEIKIRIDKEDLIKNLQATISAAGLTFNGGVENVDISSLASAIQKSVENMSSMQNEKSEQSQVPDTKPEDNKKYYKVLNEQSIGMDRVVEAFKDLLNVNATTKESNAYKQFTGGLKNIGVDFNAISTKISEEKLNEEQIKALIIQTINDALMSTDSMGKPKGGTIEYDISQSLKGVAKTSTTHKKADELLKWILELYKRNDIETESIEAYYQRVGNYDRVRSGNLSVEKAGRALAGRQGLWTNTSATNGKKPIIPELQAFTNAIEYFSDAGLDTSMLQQLKEARETLDTKDPAKLAEFQQLFDDFWNQTKGLAKDLKVAFGNFQGKITLENGKSVHINKAKDFTRIAKDAVIKAVEIYRGHESMVFGNGDLEYTDARTKRHANMFEMMENIKAGKPPYISDKPSKDYTLSELIIGDGKYDPNRRNKITLTKPTGIQNVAEDIKTIDAAINDRKQTIEQLEKTISDSKWDSGIKERQATLDRAKKAQEENQEKIAELEKQQSEYTIEKELESRRAALERKIKGAQLVGNRQGMSQYQAELDALTAESIRPEVESKLQTIGDQLIKANDEAKELDSNVKRAQSALDKFKAKYQDKHNELTKANAELESLEKAKPYLEKNKVVQDYDAALDKRQAASDKLRKLESDGVSKTNAEWKKANEELTNANKKVDKLTQSLQKLGISVETLIDIPKLEQESNKLKGEISNIEETGVGQDQLLAKQERLLEIETTIQKRRHQYMRNALVDAQQINDNLRIAQKQQRVLDSEKGKIETNLATVNARGLDSTYGREKHREYAYAQTEKFKQSDAYKAIEAERRAILEQQLSQPGVTDETKNKLWTDFRMEMRKIAQDFRLNILADPNDPGHVFIPRYEQGGDGRYYHQTQTINPETGAEEIKWALTPLNTQAEKVDLKGIIVDTLTKWLDYYSGEIIDGMTSEQIAEQEYKKSLPGMIDLLKQQKADAMYHGGLSYTDLRDADLIEERIKLEERILYLRKQQLESDKVLAQYASDEIQLAKSTTQYKEQLTERRRLKDERPQLAQSRQEIERQLRKLENSSKEYNTYLEEKYNKNKEKKEALEKDIATDKSLDRDTATAERRLKELTKEIEDYETSKDRDMEAEKQKLQTQLDHVKQKQEDNYRRVELLDASIGHYEAGTQTAKEIADAQIMIGNIDEQIDAKNSPETKYENAKEYLAQQQQLLAANQAKQDELNKKLQDETLTAEQKNKFQEQLNKKLEQEKSLKDQISQTEQRMERYSRKIGVGKSIEEPAIKTAQQRQEQKTQQTGSGSTIENFADLQAVIVAALREYFGAKSSSGAKQPDRYKVKFSNGEVMEGTQAEIDKKLKDLNKSDNKGKNKKDQLNASGQKLYNDILANVGKLDGITDNQIKTQIKALAKETETLDKTSEKYMKNQYKMFQLAYKHSEWGKTKNKNIADLAALKAYGLDKGFSGKTNLSKTLVGMGYGVDSNSSKSKIGEVKPKVIIESKELIKAIDEAEKQADTTIDIKTEVDPNDIDKSIETAAKKSTSSKRGTSSKKFNPRLNEYNAAVRKANQLAVAHPEVMGFEDGQLISKSDLTVVSEYVSEYDKLIQLQQSYIKNHTTNDLQIEARIRQQALETQQLGKAMVNTLALQDKARQSEMQTFTDKNGMVHALGGVKEDLTADEAQRLQTTMQKYAQSVLGVNLEHTKFNTTTKTLIGTVRQNDHVVSDMAVQYDAASNSLYLYNKQERESLGGLPGFMNALKSKSKAIMQYIASMTSIYRVLSMLRQGVTYIKEIDRALTELRKVTDETEETYDKFLDTAAKTADKVGSTIKDVVSSTADWARLNI